MSEVVQALRNAHIAEQLQELEVGAA
jgi:hypothetical protein